MESYDIQYVAEWTKNSDPYHDMIKIHNNFKKSTFCHICTGEGPETELFLR